MSKERNDRRKLELRAKRKIWAPVTPLSSKKYQKDWWSKHFYHTELAVHDLLQKAPHVTDAMVRQAYVRLGHMLQAGEPGPLPEGTEVLDYRKGNEVDYLVWSVRQNWAQLVREVGPVESDDFVGILRTLLKSMATREEMHGPDGYVMFVNQFLA